MHITRDEDGLYALVVLDGAVTFHGMSSFEEASEMGDHLNEELVKVGYEPEPWECVDGEVKHDESD